MTLAERAISQTNVTPQAHRWTRDEYHRMADAGVFQNQRVELIEGEVFDMAPQNAPHFRAIDKTQEALRSVFPASSNWVRAQGPLNLSIHSEPEPDVSVSAGRRDDHPDHPTTALLIVEVSDSTLRFDRETKSTVYARTGIREYWIVNIPERQLEVHRNPVGSGEDARYSIREVLKPSDTVAPLAAPQAKIRVADLLP
jgi:Uma2 family endonuclease